MLGATETLYFLLDNPDHPMPPPGFASDGQEDNSSPIKRVMVVDDEMLIAESLVEILRGEGFQAIAVSNGAAAIQWAEMLEPDALICDIAMPGMDGFEVAKHIRESLPACRIILFSGHSSVHRLLANAPLAHKDFEFLAKPFQPDLLITMLRDPRPNSG